MTDIANVAVDPSYDLTSIVSAAGSQPDQCFYEEGRLHVRGVTQSALDAALAAYDPTEVVDVVPQVVSRAQAKIQLLRAGLLEAVKTAVAGDPEMKIWFEDAVTWDRQNPHVIALGEGALALDPADIDALFIAAAQIAA